LKRSSNRLILLIGIFLAAVVAVGVMFLLSGQPSGGGGTGPTPPPAKAATVVAARDIPLGVTVTLAMVTTQEILVADRVAGALGDKGAAVGQVARQSITAGQQISALHFLDQGSTSRLECPAGLSCIAVQVDQLSGVGTLIKTGDYVDLVAGVGNGKFPIVDSDTVTLITPDLYDPTSVKVLLQGMQVVATLLPPAPTTETGVASPAPAAEPGTALNGQQEIVILAVTPQQAEVIKFAQLDGSITLTLRSPKDFVDANGNPIIPETVVTTGVILKTMVEDYGVLPPDLILVVKPTPAP